MHSAIKSIIMPNLLSHAVMLAYKNHKLSLCYLTAFCVASSKTQYKY